MRSGKLAGANGTRLHYEEYGRGASLVLGHGFGGSARNFRAQARALEAERRVILFDARGHARSEAPIDPQAYSERVFATDFACVAARSPDPVIAGGLSMGAASALVFAAAHPERVRALVLAAPPRGGPEQRAWALAFAESLENEGLEAAGAEFVWGARSRFDPSGAAFIRQGFLEHDPRALALVLRRFLAELPPTLELVRPLAERGIPILCVVGSNDTASLSVGEAIDRELGGAELVVIEGAGHVVNLAAPAAFNAALERFLSEIT